MTDTSNSELKITGDPWDDFQAWIETGKPFAFGKKLIKEYSNNTKLVRYFHGKQSSEKLAKYMEMNLNAIFLKWKKK